MGKLLLLFIIVPTIELILLLKVGSLIGILPTVAVILITGVLGAGLARMQGLGVLQQLQADMGGGRLPAGAMVDGAIILVAAALLMTPGFLTDIFGFLCLIPSSRNVMKRLIWARVERAVKRGNVNIYVSGREP